MQAGAYSTIEMFRTRAHAGSRSCNRWLQVVTGIAGITVVVVRASAVQALDRTANAESQSVLPVFHGACACTRRRNICIRIVTRQAVAVVRSLAGQTVVEAGISIIDTIYRIVVIWAGWQSCD